jgi:hypothetical protein
LCNLNAAQWLAGGSYLIGTPRLHYPGIEPDNAMVLGDVQDLPSGSIYFFAAIAQVPHRPDLL